VETGGAIRWAEAATNRRGAIMDWVVELSVHLPTRVVGLWMLKP
jgi:hypothetical protein